MEEASVTHGCQHYRRKCSLITPCCNKIYSCRICHDEIEDHVLDRKSVQEIQCFQCKLKQGVARNCSSCGVLFASYSCLICRLYDDNDRKQFHCDGCGICRVGGRENFFHCMKCDMCIGIGIKDTHKCLETISRKNCPVCLEDIHTSRLPIHVPDCSHLLHRACFEGMLKHGVTSCPVCNQSLMDLSEFWRQLDEEVSVTIMPAAFQNYNVSILCRDCHKESKVVFHIVGLKCSHCGSYNTVRIGGDDPFPGELVGSALHTIPNSLDDLPSDESWETVSHESVDEDRNAGNEDD